MSSRRRVNRRRRKQSSGVLPGIAVGVVLAALIGALLLIGSADGGSAAPEVAQERLDLDPMLGDPDAPVTIVEYGAYSCHGCQLFHESGTIDRILEEFDGRVNFVFRDFPVISPAYDERAAQVAQCALDQDVDAFWALHDAFYTTHYMTQQTIPEFVTLGETVGLDSDDLRTCLNDGTHRQTVEYDRSRAGRLGLRGTPSLFVNERQVFDLSYEALRAAVEAALNS